MVAVLKSLGVADDIRLSSDTSGEVGWRADLVGSVEGRSGARG